MDTSAERARLARARRLRDAAKIGATALALAIVIFVVGALTTGKHPQPAPVASPARTALAGEHEYSAGLAALAAGDATQAVALLTTAAAAGNPAAKTKLAEIANAGQGTTTPPRQPVPPGAYDRPAADLRGMLPASVAGYAEQEVETSTLSAILPLEPELTGPRGVSLAVLTVFDQKTEANARAYVDGFARSYAKDLSAARVGTQAARFGTDGSHLAAAIFSRGRYAFEAVVTVSNGAPANMRDTVLAVATAFPAAH